MNSRQIEAFQAVVQTGNMTLAGRLLYISQPAVSRLINELEQDIGFKLFIRRKVGMQPTPEGRMLYEDVEKHFIGLKELQQTAEAIRTSKKGQLRIIAMPGVVHLMLPKVMRSFWQRYPAINVEIESLPRIEILNRINTRLHDVGIANLPIDSSEIKIHTSFDTKLQCVMCESHPLASKKCVHIKDLDRQDLILYPLETYIRYQIENILKKKGIKYRIKLTARSTSDIYQFVKYGLGISIIFPFDKFGNEKIPGLVYKPINIDFKITTGIITNKKKPPITAQNFIDLMKEILS
jgi:DNA-binding transcriptional LysR family regulator